MPSCRGCAFHLMDIFHVTKIQSTFGLYLQIGFELFQLNFDTLMKDSVEVFPHSCAESVEHLRMHCLQLLVNTY